VKRRQRAVLAVILVLLLLLLCVLLWFYTSVVMPPRTANTAQPAGIDHVSSLYMSNVATGFVRPARLDIAPDGTFVVGDTDPDVRRIVRIDRDGRFLHEFTPTVAWGNPQGIGVWPDGTVWVGDFAADVMVVFDERGAETGRFAVERPAAINIVDDVAYVSSVGHVFMYDRSGDVLDVRGLGRGSRDGQLDGPHGCVPADGDIIVADSLNSRVVRLDADSDVVWSVGFRERDMNAAPEGPYNLPTDLVIGQHGYVFVLDAFEHRVFVVDPDSGEILHAVGEMGSAEGALFMPDGFRHIEDDLYVVADKFNSRLQVLRITLPGDIRVDASERPLGLEGWARVLTCAGGLTGLLLLIALLVMWASRRSRRDQEPAGDREADS
jgi:streptogramin lyase